MNKRPEKVNPEFWDSIQKSNNPATAETIRLLILRFVDSQNLMALAHNELAAGLGEMALQHAHQSGARHADFQVVSEQLERGGLDVDKILADAGLTPVQIPARPIALSPVLLDSRELATVLHTLHCLQENRVKPGECMHGECEHFADTTVLTSEEIDTLCDRLN